jgi:hypothetical protein
MNSIAKSVFPHPGPPLISDGLPFGSPPPVISSKPLIPEGIFSNSAAPAIVSVLFFLVRHHYPYVLFIELLPVQIYIERVRQDTFPVLHRDKAEIIAFFLSFPSGLQLKQ